MRLGIIARSDNTGLGNQTRDLVAMLNPHRIMLVNSMNFNRNKQHPEWYKDYNQATWDLTYTMRSTGDYMNEQKDRAELLITNYEQN